MTSDLIIGVFNLTDVYRVILIDDFCQDYLTIEPDPPASSIAAAAAAAVPQVGAVVRATKDFNVEYDTELELRLGDLIDVVSVDSSGFVVGVSRRTRQRGDFHESWVELVEGSWPTAVAHGERPWKHELPPPAPADASDASSVYIELKSSPYAVVKHDFSARYDTELSLRCDDHVELIRRVDNDWFEGRCVTTGGPVGIFPSCYVTVVVDVVQPLGDEDDYHVQKTYPPPTNNNVSPEATPPAPPPPRCDAHDNYSSPLDDVESKGRLTRDYDALQPGELTLRRGDIVSVLKSVEGDFFVVSTEGGGGGGGGANQRRVGLCPLSYIDLDYTDFYMEPVRTFSSLILPSPR